MDTKINKPLLSEWATTIYKNNEEAITNLNDFKTLVNSLPKAYESLATEAFIDNITKDLEDTTECHTAMESLQTFLEKVVENAENV